MDPFDGVALDLSNNQFKSFVDDIRRAQVIFGDKEKKVQPTEDHKYEPNEKAN